jgi:hypothetical protein
MKSLLAAASASIIVAALCVQPAAQPARGALTIEQLIDIKHPSAPMWSPDGKLGR